LVESAAALVDDVTAERLVGAAAPSLTLVSTEGPVVVAELASELFVLFVYPHATGTPDPPVGSWPMIAGARGCTAQACGFRDQETRLRNLGAKIAGLSVQTIDEQRAFARRVGLTFALISDPRCELAVALHLPTFEAEGRIFYRRVTLVWESGRVIKALGNIREPERNAVDVAEWLERRRGVT